MSNELKSTEEIFKNHSCGIENKEECESTMYRYAVSLAVEKRNLSRKELVEETAQKFDKNFHTTNSYLTDRNFDLPTIEDFRKNYSVSKSDQNSDGTEILKPYFASVEKIPPFVEKLTESGKNTFFAMLHNPNLSQKALQNKYGGRAKNLPTCNKFLKDLFGCALSVVSNDIMESEEMKKFLADNPCPEEKKPKSNYYNFTNNVAIDNIKKTYGSNAKLSGLGELVTTGTRGNELKNPHYSLYVNAEGLKMIENHYANIRKPNGKDYRVNYFLSIRKFPGAINDNTSALGYIVVSGFGECSPEQCRNRRNDHQWIAECDRKIMTLRDTGNLENLQAWKNIVKDIFPPKELNADIKLYHFENLTNDFEKCGINVGVLSKEEQSLIGSNKVYYEDMDKLKGIMWLQFVYSTYKLLTQANSEKEHWEKTILAYGKTLIALGEHKKDIPEGVTDTILRASVFSK